MPGSSSTSTVTLWPPKSSTMIESAAVGIGLSMNANELRTLPSSFINTLSATSNKCSTPTPFQSMVGSPIILHHTPIRSRDIGEDMEQIRLSRQDNPYLQRVAGSQATLVDEDCIDSAVSDNEDTTQLVAPSMSEDVLSLSEVHEHLIRSPPPTELPKAIKHFVFDSSFIDSYKTLPPLKANFNSMVLMNQEDTEKQFHPVNDSQRKLSVPKDCNVTSASAPNSPARIQSRSDPYVRKPHTRPLLGEDGANLLLGTGSAAEDGCYKTKIPTGLVQQPRGHPQRVPEQVFLNKPLLSHVSSVKHPIRSSVSPDDIHFTRSSSLTSTTNLTVNGSNLTLPIKCPHHLANSQVA